MSGTVTVVATTEGSNVPPRVRLDVTDIGGTNSTVTVVRLNPDGRTVPVRTPDGNPLILTTSGLNKVGLIYDYEMPLGQIVQYSTLEDPSSSSGEVSVASSQVWLVHPGVPELSQPIEFRAGSFSEETLPVKQGVFYPMGRESPIVVSDGTRHSGESSFSIITETLPDLAAIRSLISDGGALLLNVPPAAGVDVDTAYIAVSDVTIRRMSTIGSEARREVQMPYKVIARPSGGSQSQRVYVDLLEYPTYAALMAAYPTYLDVLAGP